MCKTAWQFAEGIHTKPNTPHPNEGMERLYHGQAEKVEAYLPAINPLQSYGKSC
jgi:hypothetical protein